VAPTTRRAGTQQVKQPDVIYDQSLDQNPGVEELLQSLKTQAHIYVATGLSDFPLHYEKAMQYYKAQQCWNRFWCREEVNSELATYRAAPASARQRIREEIGAPPDPADSDPTDENNELITERWHAFWVNRSDALRQYLEALKKIEAESVTGDIEKEKVHLMRRKSAARRKLNASYGCPTEPWNAVDPMLLWNLPNIPAAQISMLARITGPAVAPVAA